MEAENEVKMNNGDSSNQFLMPGEWNLKPYQAEVIKIFRVFERICDKHGWKYYSFGGTTLGALRHKGFIPWDDDFDVAMFREDYNKFVKVIKEELPTGLEFKRGGENSPIYFSKIINVNNNICDELSKKCNLHIPYAPFVDIFALDGFPNDIREYDEWWNTRRRLRLVQLFRYPNTAGKRTLKKRIKVLIGRLAGMMLSPFYPSTKNNEEMMQLLDNLSMRWPASKCHKVVEVTFLCARSRRLTDKCLWGEGRIVPFEDGMIRIPTYAEILCTIDYGDYMTPPPLEHRIPEHCLGRAWNHI